MIGRCAGAKSCLHLQADLATTHRPRARSGVRPKASDGWADGHALRAAEDVRVRGGGGIAAWAGDSSAIVGMFFVFR